MKNLIEKVIGVLTIINLLDQEKEEEFNFIFSPRLYIEVF